MVIRSIHTDSSGNVAAGFLPLATYRKFRKLAKLGFVTTRVPPSFKTGYIFKKKAFGETRRCSTISEAMTVSKVLSSYGMLSKWTSQGRTEISCWMGNLQYTSTFSGWSIPNNSKPNSLFNTTAYIPYEIPISNIFTPRVFSTVATTTSSQWELSPIPKTPLWVTYRPL